MAVTYSKRMRLKPSKLPEQLVNDTLGLPFITERWYPETAGSDHLEAGGGGRPEAGGGDAVHGYVRRGLARVIGEVWADQCRAELPPPAVTPQESPVLWRRHEAKVRHWTAYWLQTARGWDVRRRRPLALMNLARTAVAHYAARDRPEVTRWPQVVRELPPQQDTLCLRDIARQCWFYEPLAIARHLRQAGFYPKWCAEEAGLREALFWPYPAYALTFLEAYPIPSPFLEGEMTEAAMSREFGLPALRLRRIIGRNGLVPILRTSDHCRAEEDEYFTAIDVRLVRAQVSGRVPPESPRTAWRHAVVRRQVAQKPRTVLARAARSRRPPPPSALWGSPPQRMYADGMTLHEILRCTDASCEEIIAALQAVEDQFAPPRREAGTVRVFSEAHIRRMLEDLVGLTLGQIAARLGEPETVVAQSLQAGHFRRGPEKRFSRHALVWVRRDIARRRLWERRGEVFSAPA